LKQRRTSIPAWTSILLISNFCNLSIDTSKHSFFGTRTFERHFNEFKSSWLINSNILGYCTVWSAVEILTVNDSVNLNIDRSTVYIVRNIIIFVNCPFYFLGTQRIRTHFNTAIYKFVPTKRFWLYLARNQLIYLKKRNFVNENLWSTHAAGDWEEDHLFNAFTILMYTSNTMAPCVLL
jgi:hypothetical protein